MDSWPYIPATSPIDIAELLSEKGRVFLKELDDTYELLVNLGGARIVCVRDVNILRVGAKFSENMPSAIVTKPPKPVSSVSALPIWGLLGFFGWSGCQVKQASSSYRLALR